MSLNGDNEKQTSTFYSFPDHLSVSGNSMSRVQDANITEAEMGVDDTWESKRVRMSDAEHYRTLGNESFRRGFLESAIDYYTKAINIYPENHEFYTNRALCYKKQKKWENVASDARIALNFDEDSVKAHYYLGQALLHLGNNEEAMKKLRKAKCLSEHYKVPYINEIDEEILRAKNVIWQTEDAQFLETVTSFREYVIGVTNREKQIGNLTDEMYSFRIQQLQQILGVVAKSRERHVPNYLCCKISMCIMKDPVISPSGLTYERSLLETHIKKNGEFDPITRDACTLDKIFPNYSIREAIEHFLDQNPWAYGE